MFLAEESTQKTHSSETVPVEKKQTEKLFARWIKVDGKLICRWLTSQEKLKN